MGWKNCALTEPPLSTRHLSPVAVSDPVVLTPPDVPPSVSASGMSMCRHLPSWRLSCDVPPQARLIVARTSTGLSIRVGSLPPGSANGGPPSCHRRDVESREGIGCLPARLKPVGQQVPCPHRPHRPLALSCEEDYSGLSRDLDGQTWIFTPIQP